MTTRINGRSKPQKADAAAHERREANRTCHSGLALAVGWGLPVHQASYPPAATVDTTEDHCEFGIAVYRNVPRWPVSEQANGAGRWIVLPADRSAGRVPRGPVVLGVAWRAVAG